MIPFCILIIEDEADKSFMADLYTTYEKLMYRTAYDIVTSQWLSEDVVQTALEKLIPKVELLQILSKKKRINYIISTVKNTAYSTLRKTKQTNGFAQFSIDDEVDYPAGVADTESIECRLILEEDLLCMKTALSKLSERNWHIVKSRYFLGLNSTEIAASLGETPEAVRTTLHRTMKSISEQMQKDAKG